MTDGTEGHATRAALPAGTKVDVRNAFDGSWSSGFVVEGHSAAGYRLRRRSDDEVLPEVLADDAVRRERKNSMWWY